MAGCCCSHDVRFEGVSRAYRRVLLAVIAINASMFFVEMTFGVMARSMALQADALDFLGDSLTYGISLAVIGLSLRVRSTAALVKGISLALMAAVVLGASAWRVLVVTQPNETVMSTIGVLAFVANVTSVLLLLRYRNGDANVRSVWLCSRNDAIGNLGVIGAGILVGITGTRWPDLIVAAVIAGLFMTSSVKIIRQAMAERRETATPSASCVPQHHHGGEHDHHHHDHTVAVDAAE